MHSIIIWWEKWDSPSGSPEGWALAAQIAPK